MLTAIILVVTFSILYFDVNMDTNMQTTDHLLYARPAHTLTGLPASGSELFPDFDGHIISGPDSVRDPDMKLTPAQLDIKKEMQVTFNGDASIETGSPFVGLEFHHSSPLPMRISFYYPVANSIDLSSDYWTRDQWVSMVLGLKIGDSKKEWIGQEPFEIVQTPYEVSFHKADSLKAIDISYRFSGTSPAYVATYEIRNLSDAIRDFEFYTNLEASLKTSHTYAIKDKARGELRDEGAALYISYDDAETQNVQLFTANAGRMPVAQSAVSLLDSLPVPPGWQGEPEWDVDGFRNHIDNRPAKGTTDSGDPAGSLHTPAFRYLYRQTLGPGETMRVVHITGSAAQGEGPEIVGRLLDAHRMETDAYEAHILGQIGEKPFVTGDPVLDHSVLWSHGILGANKHYIDGSIQPMPCPAQYNFYFTHDVLLSDLAAVNFDLPRVKKDLSFIISHADSAGVIPHAYYWKDLDYAKEMAPPDNWNHFWFVITAAGYLRHSGDEAFLREMYPYLERSVQDFLKHHRDGIIYSYRPDWWDIAWNFGPRSYTTILAAKALRDYVFISSVLGENRDQLAGWESDADRMQEALNETLWSDDQDYLLNYFEDGSLDTHYYIGSLLGSHYGLLNEDRKLRLAATATEKILDPEIGVYTVYPMDFHTLIDYLKLAGNEAGDPYYYINGGIWPHGNAWYALALMETGKNDEALSFIRNVMSLGGVIDSPNGQPAMYEYRVSKKDDPEVYGKIDKPQFTWAAAWYLYSLYNVYGVKENEWNITLNPWLPAGQEHVRFVLTSGGRNMMVDVQGGSGLHAEPKNGNSGSDSGISSNVESIRMNGKRVFSTVLPYGDSADAVSGTGHQADKDSGSGEQTLEIVMGGLTTPLLTGLNAVLRNAEYDEVKNEMMVEISGYPGRRVVAEFDSPFRVDRVMLNGTEELSWNLEEEGDGYTIEIGFAQRNGTDVISVGFKGK
jgi:hypothetical protein